jgi:hypothetical protein
MGTLFGSPLQMYMHADAQHRDSRMADESLQGTIQERRAYD